MRVASRQGSLPRDCRRRALVGQHQLDCEFTRLPAAPFYRQAITDPALVSNMTNPLDHTAAAAHRLLPMAGRDPLQSHRAATPLELLFDLTLVISFGSAAAQLAHYVADGHVASGLAAFGLVMFAVCWAWVNYSWFSSAYDTDDWAFRVATLIQMIGVIVLSLGIPRAFVSIDRGALLDIGVIVLGYVIMRLAMVSLWLRAAKQDPARRKTCLTYA